MKRRLLAVATVLALGACMGSTNSTRTTSGGSIGGGSSSSGSSSNGGSSGGSSSSGSGSSSSGSSSSGSGSSSGGSSSSGSGSSSSGSSSSGSAASVAWTFNGGAASASLSAGTAPAAVTIPSGANVGGTLSVQFGTPSAGGTVALSDATDGCCGTSPDVTPATLPSDNAPTEGGTPGGGNNAVVYLSFVNSGSTAISFSGTPALTLTATAGASGSLGTIAADVSCQLDLFTPPSTWTPVPGAVTPLSPNATSASIPAGTQAFAIPPGQTIAAVGCD